MNIRLDNVAKRFGSVAALDDVSLDISPGQLIAVLGANGAGKSTLLRLLATVQLPTSGTIHFDDQPLSRARLDLRKRLMMLPDVPPIVGNGTPLGHLADLIGLYEAERPGLEDLVVSLYSELDLLPLVECSFSQLSRGQTYKAVLAALFAVDPELWLLDEPFAAGMDPQGLATLKRQVSKATARGRTVFYTTQLLELAEQFSDRVLILHHGRVHAFDTLANLKTGSLDEHGLEGLFAKLRTEVPA
jgi:ABC-type multidrug transport system ATPase subunit